MAARPSVKSLTIALWHTLRPLIEFVANEGRPQTRDDLSRRVFNREWQPYDRSLDSVVVKLRRKLERDPENPLVIKTVRGKGYVFTGFP